MIISRRLITAGLFFLYLAGGYILNVFPAYVVPISVTLLGLVLIGVVAFFWKADTSYHDLFLYVSSVMLLYAAGTAFFVFLERSALQYITLLGVASVAFLYLDNAYKFLWKDPEYHVSALSNISSYMHLLSIFFATVALFDLRFFFGITVLALLIISAGFAFLLFYCYLWSQKILIAQSWLYALLFMFLFVQYIYVLNIWPHVPLVKGVVTLAFVYAMMQILLASLRDILQLKKVLKTLWTIALVLAAVLMTAQWR